MHYGHGHHGVFHHALKLGRSIIPPGEINSVLKHEIYDRVSYDYRISMLSVSMIDRCKFLVAGPPFPITVGGVISETGIVAVGNLFSVLPNQNFAPEHHLTPSWIGVSHESDGKTFLTRSEFAWVRAMFLLVHKYDLQDELTSSSFVRF